MNGGKITEVKVINTINDILTYLFHENSNQIVNFFSNIKE